MTWLRHLSHRPFSGPYADKNKYSLTAIHIILKTSALYICRPSFKAKIHVLKNLHKCKT